MSAVIIVLFDDVRCWRQFVIGVSSVLCCCVLGGMYRFAIW